MQLTCVNVLFNEVTLEIFGSTGKSGCKVISKLYLIRYHESVNSPSILSVLIVKYLVFRHTLKLMPTD